MIKRHDNDFRLPRRAMSSQLYPKPRVPEAATCCSATCPRDARGSAVRGHAQPNGRAAHDGAGLIGDAAEPAPMRLSMRLAPPVSCGYVIGMSANADRIRQLFDDIDRLDFVAVASHCADDCVYEDVPLEMATAVGPEAIRAKLEMGLSMLERLPTTIHELVEAGDTMMVERTEVWHHKTGERATLRVAAVFKFRAGKLTVWRDYWDAKTLLSQQPATWLPDIPRP